MSDATSRVSDFRPTDTGSSEALEDQGPKLADEYHWYSEHTALLVNTLKWALLGQSSAWSQIGA